jgi:hypothetical protein
MKVASIIDEHLARPHGNRQGLSYGELAVLLLTYIVSEGDHKICCFPLAMTQPRPLLLADWVNNPPTEVLKIMEKDERESKSEEIGLGFEVPLGSIWVDPETEQKYQWDFLYSML